MKLRKKRIPLHGFTITPSQSHKCLHTSLSNHSELVHPFKESNSCFKGLRSLEQPFQNKRSSKTFNKIKKSLRTDNLDQKSKQIIQKLRYQYRNKANIRKIIKSWKFQNKGYLSVQEFCKRLNKNFGINTTHDECEEVLKEFSTNGDDKLDTQGFLNMIYYEPSNMILNHKLYDPSDEEQKRQSKINNLIDKLQFYCLEKNKKHIYEMDDHQLNDLVKMARRNSIKLRQSIKNPNQVRSAVSRWKEDEEKAMDIVSNELNLNPVEDEGKIERQVYNSLVQGKNKRYSAHKNIKSQQNCSQYFSKTHFQKFNTMTTMRLTNSLKKTTTNAFPFFKENQTKTRFNGTPTPSKLILGVNNGEYSNSKAFQIIQNQKNVTNRRYEARLDKIRKYKTIEQENINRIQEKKETVDKHNLNKIKLDQEAYNYAAFIQNKWQ